MKKKFKLKRYKEVRDLFHAFFQAPEIIRYEEGDESCTIGCVDEDGSEQEFSLMDVVGFIEEHGLWGFVDRKRVIHFWMGERATKEKVIEFLSHEIAHHEFEDMKFRGEIEEEEFMDRVSGVAKRAYEMMKEVLK